MQPTESSPASWSFEIGEFKQVVANYLKHAYPEGTIPASVQRRLNWPAEVVNSTDLLALPGVFEKSLDGAQNTIYALRLGNHRYPHMKLQIQTFPFQNGYILGVDTHDQIRIPDNAQDAEKFHEIQRENQRLKELIEADWLSQGLPTFHAYLRSYLTNNLEK